MSMLIVEADGPVVSVRLNRPERHNALLPELWNELRAVGARLLGDDSVRCVVLSGEGASFCTGIDRRALAEGVLTPFSMTGDPADRDRTAFEERDIEAAQAIARWLIEGDFVTIAAVAGFALGAGAQLALACDLRILGTDARIALPEVEIGLLPEMSAVAVLPRIVGYARALELALTARTVDADEALRIGLANAVVEPGEVLAAALDLAARIARCRPDAIRYTKRAMRAGAAGDVDGALRIARTGGVRLIGDLLTGWDRP